MATLTAGFERATVIAPELVGDEVVKTSLMPLATAEQANKLRAQLERYHTAVAAGPLAMAELLRTSTIATPRGFYVQHVTKYVPGTPLSQLPQQERRAAVGELAQTVMAMPSLPGSNNLLRTPIDGRPRNFVAGKLVDGCPPWEWAADGYVFTELLPNLNTNWRATNTNVHGSRTGVLAELMIGAAPDIEPPESPVTYWRRARATAQEWCRDLLPALSPAQYADFDVRLDVNLAQRVGLAMEEADNPVPAGSVPQSVELLSMGAIAIENQR